MSANIQWFPGHMKKTLGLIKQNLNLVDCVVEILDARVASSSKNPLVNDIIKNKPSVVCFNKSDLADDKANLAWQEFYKKQAKAFVLTDAQNGKNIKELISVIKREVDKSFEEKKRTNRRGRIMIVGIPNVGKSTLINRLVGRKACQTGNKPGVTKGKQWLRISNELELLDTPGVLWHKFDDEQTAINLAITGAIKDEILQIDELALKLIEILQDNYLEAFSTRYSLELEGLTPLEAMEAIGKKRGFLASGGFIDYDRVANMLLDEFRKGIITKVSLELTLIFGSVHASLRSLHYG